MFLNKDDDDDVPSDYNRVRTPPTPPSTNNPVQKLLNRSFKNNPITRW